MPRARNLKHDFFLDDELAEHPALARIFFQSLWCLADYKGDIEWREKKIKAQTLPYDDCDIKEFAINLDKSGFIRFYSDGNKIYLNIRKFSHHQNPHKNERDKGSDIPEFNENMRQVVDLTTITINLDKSGVNHDKNETNPADSLNPIPDSLNPIPEPEKPKKTAQAPKCDFDVSVKFEEFWKTYPKKSDKQKSEVKFKKVCESLGDFEKIMEGLNAQIKNNWSGTEKQFIPNPTTWLNGARWNDEIIPPAIKQNKAPVFDINAQDFSQ